MIRIDDQAIWREINRLWANTPRPIAARVYNSSAISVANNTWVTLTFNAERYDTADLHSTSSNTDRLTAPAPGIYLITAHLRFQANANGDRIVSIVANGTTTIAMETQRATAAVVHDLSIATMYYLAAGHYVTVSVQQTSGTTLNVEATGNYSPEFAMIRLCNIKL